MKAWTYLLIALLSLSVVSAIPAFPGAEGHGATSIGGRGGEVMFVTTLADDHQNPIPGSLRECMEATGPRTCIFRVAGYIELKDTIIVHDGRLTVAGQTAPGDGITIRRHESKMDSETGCNAMSLVKIGGYRGDYKEPKYERLGLGSSGLQPFIEDVVIRYIRIRQGGPKKADACKGAQDSGSNLGYSGTKRTMIDHLTVGWANDNQMGGGGGSGHRSMGNQRVTTQRTLIHEPMVGHNTGLAIAGSGLDKITTQYPIPSYKKGIDIDIHHSLFQSVGYRNPTMKVASARTINNIVYNWGSSLVMTGKDAATDIINNYWKSGPARLSPGKTNNNRIEWDRDTEDPYMPSIHYVGNILDIGSGKRAANWNDWHVRDMSTKPTTKILDPIDNAFKRSTPLPKATHRISIQSADAAYNSILDDVGANKRLDCKGDWVWIQDAVDARLIQEVKSRTGQTGEKQSVAEAGGWPTIRPGTPCTDTDNDGMPNEFENRYGTNPSVKDHNGDKDGDGYTNLEEYLNGYSTVVTPPVDECDIDIDCPGEEICVNNMCVDDPTPPPSTSDCSADYDCAQGEICVDNKCIDKPLPPPDVIKTSEWEAEIGIIDSPFSIVSDSSASNGQYIVVPEGTGHNNDPATATAKASYAVEVQEGGTYMIWGYVNSPDGGSNSFYTSIDEGEKFAWATAPIGGGWAWDQVNIRDLNSQTRTFELTPGIHTINIYWREDGTMLDKLLLTNDLSYHPKNPTNHDVNGDGTVNLFDLVLVASNIGTNNLQYDVNSDGTVNLFDLVLVAGNIA